MRRARTAARAPGEEGACLCCTPRTVAKRRGSRSCFLARIRPMRDKATMAVQGRRVLLCVGGGIAAYKACEVARLLVKAGASVRAAMTPSAQRFVAPMTFQALTGQPVAADLWDAQQELTAGHIALADWAEVAVI